MSDLAYNFCAVGLGLAASITLLAGDRELGLLYLIAAVVCRIHARQETSA